MWARRLGHRSRLRRRCGIGRCRRRWGWGQIFDTTSTATDRFVGQVFFNSYWNGNPTDNPQISYQGQEIYVDQCTVHIGPSLPPNVDTVMGYPIIGDWEGVEIRP